MKKTLVVIAAMFIAVAAFGLSQGGFLDSDLYVPAPFKIIFGTGVSSDAVISRTGSGVINIGSAADSLKVNSVIVPQSITARYVTGTTAAATDQVFFLADAAYTVTGCSEIHAVAAGGASALEVVKDTSTNAPGAGTDLLTDNTNTGFDLAAVANTVQNGTLVTGAALTLAAGDRLAVDYANAIQSTAGVAVTCTLKRV